MLFEVPVIFIFGLSKVLGIREAFYVENWFVNTWTVLYRASLLVWNFAALALFAAWLDFIAVLWIYRAIEKDGWDLKPL
jgi:hypothetical protein